MKVSKYISIGLLVIVACNPFVKERGNGTIVSESWDLNDFSKIELTGSYDVELIKGNIPSVTIETDENLFEHISH